MPMALFQPLLPLTSLPRRDRMVILLALAGVTALAWVYLIDLSAHMKDMGSGEPGTLVQIKPWRSADFVFMGLMWAVMMVGMMVPSAAPMTLIYAALARKAARQGTPLPPTAVFVSGYLVIWCLFSVGARHPDRGWRVPTDTVERSLPAALQVSCALHLAAMATGCRRRVPDGTRARGVLPRVLLGPDGVALLRWSHEPPLDCRDHLVCVRRKGAPLWCMGRASRRWRDDPHRRCRAGVLAVRRWIDA